MIALQTRRGPIVAKEIPSRPPAPALAPPGGFLQNRRIRRKQAQAGLLAAGVVTAALICWGFADLFVTQAKIALAEKQTAVFEEMAEEAELGSVATAVASLDCVVGVPSRTKPQAGSPLDRMVERSRHAAAVRIVAALRKKTGFDYGDDPRAWLRELR